LFLEELLDLKEGRDRLRDMTLQLGRDLNWQTAFLAAFQANFESLLAVEKWWDVACVDFRSSDSGEFASNAEVWRHLQETLDVPVEVRLVPGRLPCEALITLQEAITQWSKPDAESAIVRALVRLQMQSYRATTDLRPMVNAYIAALSHYLQAERALAQRGSAVRNADAQAALLKGEACAQLDALDAQRDRLRSDLLLSKNQKVP
jgi:hypothetical protein